MLEQLEEEDVQLYQLRKPLQVHLVQPRKHSTFTQFGNNQIPSQDIDRLIFQIPSPDKDRLILQIQYILTQLLGLMLVFCLIESEHYITKGFLLAFYKAENEQNAFCSFFRARKYFRTPTDYCLDLYNLASASLQISRGGGGICNFLLFQRDDN